MILETKYNGMTMDGRLESSGLWGLGLQFSILIKDTDIHHARIILAKTTFTPSQVSTNIQIFRAYGALIFALASRPADFSLAPQFSTLNIQGASKSTGFSQMRYALASSTNLNF
jgi:hypothetical protein